MWSYSSYLFSFRELFALHFGRKSQSHKLSKTSVELFIFHRLPRPLKWQNMFPKLAKTFKDCKNPALTVRSLAYATILIQIWTAGLHEWSCCFFQLSWESVYTQHLHKLVNFTKELMDLFEKWKFVNVQQTVKKTQTWSYFYFRLAALLL